MKLLHTSDWHVGKAVRGRDRHGEHTAVLAEIASLADTHQVDVVLVAGDLFDSATPSALSERVVYQALVSLARPGRHVVVIAGNHDHPGRLAAVAPLLDATGVHVAAAPLRPDEGGVLELSTPGGEIARAGVVAVREPASRHERRRLDGRHPLHRRPELPRQDPPDHRHPFSRIRQRRSERSGSARVCGCQRLGRRRRTDRSFHRGVLRASGAVPILGVLCSARACAPLPTDPGRRSGVVLRVASAAGFRGKRPPHPNACC